ncbi:hypothetical protein DVH24_021457 [Malus domestica]|uniref:Uncharacterized protein n=1 Tax=Malus domestica TaxID=3750 RepID=A0A498JWU4_MALDO|nr:hypothetical protein DVH24_021457 [Malus domestica]
MAANSSAHPATLANPELPMVKVCNIGEEEAFLASCSYLLYECRVKWEDIDKVTIDLPSLSNPNCLCTRILPCYLYLGLRFHFSQLWKEILVAHGRADNIDLCSSELIPNPKWVATKVALKPPKHANVCLRLKKMKKTKEP